MKTTKIVAFAKGRVELVTEELGALRGNQVLVQTLYSAISPGTEVAWLHHMANTPGKYPYYPGYSSCGKVLETGAGVEGIKPGDTVVCRAEHWSHYIADADKCTVVPPGISPLEASAYRMASIAMQGVRKADIEIGEDVAVLGLGAVGNLASQISRVAGAGCVCAFDPVDWRRELGGTLGIDKTLSDPAAEEHKNRYDVVVEATGVASAVNTALDMVRQFGRVILLGSSRGNTDNVNFYLNVHKKGATIVGAHDSARPKHIDDRFGHFRPHIADEQVVIKLMAAKRISLLPLISEVVDARDAQSIYDRLLGKKEKLMLAAFEFRG